MELPVRRTQLTGAGGRKLNMQLEEHTAEELAPHETRKPCPRWFTLSRAPVVAVDQRDTFTAFFTKGCPSKSSVT